MSASRCMLECYDTFVHQCLSLGMNSDTPIFSITGTGLCASVVRSLYLLVFYQLQGFVLCAGVLESCAR